MPELGVNKRSQHIFSRVDYNTRNALDRDQSNYSSRIFCPTYIVPIKFGQTGNTAIRSADPENPP